MTMMLGLNLSLTGQNGGGGGAASPMALHLFGHQSNNVGGDVNGAIVSPADDAVTGVSQWSPNGGGAYTGGVGQFPASANVLLPSTGHSRFPGGNWGTDTNVGRAHSYAVTARTANPTEPQTYIPFGVGGTSTAEYLTGAGVPTNWPANRYTVFKTSYDLLKAAYPDSYVSTIVASIAENEIINATGVSNFGTDLDNWVTTFRAIGGTGASTAPIVWATPLKEWINNDATSMAYVLEAHKAAVRNTGIAIFRPRNGYSRAGDTVHMTNVGNRLMGPDMYAMRALALAPPTSTPAFSLVGNTGVLVCTGAPYYEVYVTPLATGVTTKYDYVPLEYSFPGATVKFTLPGVGTRDVYVIAKSSAGNSAPTPTLTYTLPSSSAAARVSLDFTNATLDGSSNMTSVPSDGSDTTAWDPVSTAGTGGTAAIKRQLVGSKYVAILDATTKSFIRTGYTWDAGDWSFAFGIYYNTLATTGVLVGAGQTGSSLDIYVSLANSGLNIRMGNNSTTVQLLTTSNPFNFNFKIWHFLGFSYNRTTNIGTAYLNDEVVLSGAMTLRSASPSNSGGSKFFNNGAASSTGGWGTGLAPVLMMPPKFYNAALSANDFQKTMNDYKVDHGVNFGYAPPVAI